MITFTNCSNCPNSSFLLAGVPADKVNSVLLQLKDRGCHVVGWGFHQATLGKTTLAVLELQPSYAQIFDLAGQFSPPPCAKPLKFTEAGILMINCPEQEMSIPFFFRERWILQKSYCSLNRLTV